MTFFDVVARALRRWGYRVFYVQNVTNLDYKLIARAAEEDVDPLALADRHFHEFHGYPWSASGTGRSTTTRSPRTTFPGSSLRIRQLIEKGYAYVTDDGSVYYSVGKFPGGREAFRAEARGAENPGRDSSSTPGSAPPRIS